MSPFYSRLSYSLPMSALAILAFISPVSAQVVNGSFESNAAGSQSITGWTTTGSAIVTDSSFGDSPTDGTKQLFLNNDPEANLGYTTSDSVNTADLESFFNLQSGALSGLGKGAVINGSGIKQTFTLTQSETLSFDYNFLTSEDPAFPPANPDFGFISLSGAASNLSVLADVGQATTLEPVQTGRTSPSIDDYLSETGYNTYTYQALLGPGTYTLGLGVVNAVTPDVGSGLLVDNVSFQPVPEASTSISMALLLGLGGLLVSRRRLTQNSKSEVKG